jgi:hypothetical protein
MAKCYRVCNPPSFPNPLNAEPVVALVEAAPNVRGIVGPESEVEERLGGAGGAGAPTSGILHGSSRLKPSIQSLIPAESIVSA